MCVPEQTCTENDPTALYWQKDSILTTSPYIRMSFSAYHKHPCAAAAMKTTTKVELSNIENLKDILKMVVNVLTLPSVNSSYM